MQPSFHPRLVNDPFDDPGLFIPFLFEKRAIIFDLGDIHSLSTRDILKISHVFITHTHMDHIVGFDRLLRLFLGREKTLYIYGPRGFLGNVEGKLAGYSWNLVKHYKSRFCLHAVEVTSEFLTAKQYLCQEGFLSEQDAEVRPFDSILLGDPSLLVSTVILDHRIPCLGFSMKERFHVNIIKDALFDLGLKVGPWLKTFKEALFTGEDPESEFEVRQVGENSKKNSFPLGELANRIAIITAGQKITYIADASYIGQNADRIIEFAAESDHLFIEAAFLDADRKTAEEKYHLTARQAGEIAGKAGAKRFTLFHFSPRYKGMEHLLRKEADAAYARFKA